ncbi:hypothetical protein DMENIID0001_138830 [Sergentomyia squamirostris]
MAEEKKEKNNIHSLKGPIFHTEIFVILHLCQFSSSLADGVVVVEDDVSWTTLTDAEVAGVGVTSAAASG